MLSKEKSMENFEIVRDFYNWDTNGKPRHEGTLTGVSSDDQYMFCLLYTSPSPRDVEESRMPSSA